MNLKKSFSLSDGLVNIMADAWDGHNPTKKATFQGRYHLFARAFYQIASRSQKNRRSLYTRFAFALG